MVKKIMLPANKPLAAGIKEYLGAIGDMNKYDVQLLGVRGYFKKTLGNPDSNDVGIYDDAIFVVTPEGVFGYNANTDPSVTRKGVAVLKEGGPYLYKIGMHNMKAPYEALRQFGRVTVIREGSTVEQTDTAAAPFYIDIHKGGFGTTSSLGCQTIHPTQWPGFLTFVKGEVKKHAQTIIPYYLTIND
jgi:lysozyme